MKKILVILLFLSMGITSCAPTEYSQLTSSTEYDSDKLQELLSSLDTDEVSKLPEHVSVQIEDGLKIDADINTWDIEDYNVTSGYAKIKEFSSDDPETKELMTKLCNYIGKDYDEGKLTIKRADGEADYNLLTYNDESSVLLGDCVSAMNQQGIYSIDCSTFDKFYTPSNSKKNFATGKEFDFATIKEATDMAKDIAGELDLNLEICEKTECYSLDEKNEIMFQNNTETVSRCDSYAIFLFPGHNGIAYSRTPQDEELTGFTNFESTLIININKNGVSYIDTHYIYEWAKDIETKEVIHPHKILEQEIESLEQYQASGDLTITEVSLEYLPIYQDNGEYMMKPVWACYYFQDEHIMGEVEYDIEKTYCDIYDAYSGEKL